MKEKTEKSDTGIPFTDERKREGIPRVTFCENMEENVSQLCQRLCPEKNFDLAVRRIRTDDDVQLTIFSLNGMMKQDTMQKILQYLTDSTELKSPIGAENFARKMPYGEVRVCSDIDEAICAVLSGQSLFLSSTFGAECLILDLREYPARPTEEPESDRVVQGSRDGFVETLLMNTALLRRRVRDERLRMEKITLGGSSKTDLVLCYMDGVAQKQYVDEIRRRLQSAKPKSLTLGFQSLAESLIRQRWYDPFPKTRTTERPDTAAAHVVEGSVLVFCDTSPQVMILPTSIFDYLQQTVDYCLSPLTGSYLRLVRIFILLLSMLATPLWYLCLMHADVLPEALSFLVPENAGSLPILLQLYIAELAIDGLRIASMNTPDILSNALSIVGGLILGDFVVDVGWLCRDVILYMAFVAIANFVQQNRELGYAFKFSRVLILTLTAFADFYGFFAGILIVCLSVVCNRTLCDGHSYLYPLIPWNGKAMKRLILRVPKDDFSEKS